MTLTEFRLACLEYLQNPEEFGSEAFADILHALADGISDDDLQKLAKECVLGGGQP